MNDRANTILNALRNAEQETACVYWPIPESVSYAGCGHGWIEFNPQGEVVDLRYADHLGDAGASRKQNVSTKFDSELAAGDNCFVGANLRLAVWFSCVTARTDDVAKLLASVGRLDDAGDLPERLRKPPVHIANPLCGEPECAVECVRPEFCNLRFE